MPFHHSTLACYDDFSVACDTLMCPCCQMSRQCSAVEGYANTMGNGMCLLSLCFGAVFPMCLRCKVSDRYQLDEACFVSFLLGSCCATCSVCATGRELNFRGVNPGGSCCSPTSVLQMGSSNNGSGSPVVININAGPQYPPQGYPPQGYPPQGYPPQQQQRY